MDLNSAHIVALHEAGHTVAFWSLAIPVSLVRAGPLGDGLTQPQARPGQPEDILLTSWAGAAAERLAGVDGYASGRDLEFIREASAEANLDRPAEQRAVRRQAEAFVWKHADAIAFLADKLEAAGELDRRALGLLCWEEGSPLHPWRALYPEARHSSAPARPGVALAKARGTAICRVSPTIRGLFGL